MSERVSIKPDVCNGRPVVRGTRITVQTVLEFLAAGDSVEDILEEYPKLTRADVGACFSVMRRSQIEKTKYRVVIEPDEDGVFVAECPALPGCISQGKTRVEALANITDAMTGYLASLKKHGEAVPPPISEEIVEIPA